MNRIDSFTDFVLDAYKGITNAYAEQHGLRQPFEQADAGAGDSDATTGAPTPQGAAVSDCGPVVKVMRPELDTFVGACIVCLGATNYCRKCEECLEHSECKCHDLHCPCDGCKQLGEDMADEMASLRQADGDL